VLFRSRWTGLVVISGENFDVWAELFSVQVVPFVFIERTTFLVLKLPTGTTQSLQVQTIGVPQHSPHGDVRLFCAIPNTAEVCHRLTPFVLRVSLRSNSDPIDPMHVRAAYNPS